MNCGVGNDCTAMFGCEACAPKTSLMNAKLDKFPKRMICQACSGDGTVNDANCARCTKTKCLACERGKAMTKDGTCVAKGKNFAGNADLEIDDVKNNCEALRYTKDDTKAFYSCDICDPGFFADSFGTCQACPAGCLFCKEKDTCAMCAPGTWWNKDAKPSPKCVANNAPKCRVPAGDAKCKLCEPGFYPKEGVCTACHFSCGECVNGEKTGCLTCKGEGVLITSQKAIGVEYEDAKRMSDEWDDQPSGKDLQKMNYAMVKAMKSAKPKGGRLLEEKKVKVKVSADEKTSFDKLDTDAKGGEKDKMSTDMSDDKMMNEIWSKRGRTEESDDSDDKKRTAMEGAKKKIR